MPKKILNGKKYDTETAKEIDYYSSLYATTDYKYFSETLYLKKTGEFFLYGQGRGLSKYASCYWKSHTGSDGFTPLSLEEAKEWVEKNCNVEIYEELFGEVKE